MDESSVERLIRLSGSVRVEAHERISKSGKSVHVDAYTRLTNAGPLSLKERAVLAWARTKSLVDLKDGKGPVEKWLRDKLDKAGLDPYDLNMAALNAHADQHAKARSVAKNRQGESRFWFKSPCWAVRDIDFTVHQVLPVMLAEKYPALANKLISTSPRWKEHSAQELLSKMRAEA